MGSPRVRRTVLMPAAAAIAIYLGAYVVAAALHPGARPTWAPDGALQALQAAGVLCALLALRSRPAGRQRRGWTFVTAGMVCFAAGGVLWTALGNPLLSVADPLFLAFPLLTGTGLITLYAEPLRAAGPDAWLDGLATALGAAALAVLLVSGPTLTSAASADGLALAVNAAYPLSALVLAGVLLCAFVATGARLDRRFVLLGVGIGAFWLANALYLRDSTANTFTAFSWYQPGWTLAMLALGAAVWTPPGTSERRRLRWQHRVLLTNGFAGVAILVLVAHATDRGVGRGGLLAVTLAVGCLVAVLLQQARTLRDQDTARRRSDDVARTDALTGLGNRRALTKALEAAATAPSPAARRTLALFDLDGFKSYNDAFGHAAGDALLRRMGDSLRQTLDGLADVFRMGGDEFCVLVTRPLDRPDVVMRTAAAAMSEHGEGFVITASYGVVTMPQEAATPEEALRLADHRMYACKRQGRASAGRQTSDVLLQALAERDGDLSGHTDKVAALCGPVARLLGLSPEAIEEAILAAQLHDVGKVAIPDAVLQKPGPLDPDEMAFIRRHTVIGERILQAAPALTNVAKIVRSTHERWDGGGYPDALAGEAIPLAARIVFVCDAYDAMSSHRPYQAARSQPEVLAELEAHAGTQFDPGVVRALHEVLAQGTGTLRTLRVA